ncbi:MAG: HRDC domain-containing protein [Bythopirellula sp.]|nr:HRDC domain-containing protein [Bythopirellula sp.]
MPSPIITDPQALEQLCERLQSASIIGIDTEFVSEDTYQPQLCLVQVATEHELVEIDPLAIADLTPFWQVMTSGEHITVLHAGREELNFFLRSPAAAVPKHLFDVQIAAGFCSNEYPSSYSSVVSKFLGHQPAKGEQRTDWRRRPLSNAQITYALEDVRYLLPLHKKLTQILKNLNRDEWLADEMRVWQDDIVAANSRKDWRRVSGIGKLSPRNLAIVRELWTWRQEEAQRRNQPPKRILRDDLLVEIAKRKIDNPDQIMAIRGMERGGAKRKAQELADCVARGLEGPTEKISRGSHTEELPSQLNLLGQFLAPALGTICRRAEIATSMVGTATDVRELIAYRMGIGNHNDAVPVLAEGWRAQLVGNVIDDLLAGTRSIRITNALADDPLVFEKVDQHKSS